MGQRGGTAYDDFFDDDSVAAELTNTQLTLNRFFVVDRHRTGDGHFFTPTLGNIDWFVVGLAPVTVKTPNGGETLLVNDSYNITWKAAASVANVKLEYSDDNGGIWKTIIASTPPPRKLTPGPSVMIPRCPILPTLERRQIAWSGFRMWRRRANWIPPMRLLPSE